MCAVSGILDYGRQNIPLTNWTRDTFAEYKEIIRRLEELDRKMGEPNCERPGKRAWMKKVEERLAKLEADRPA